MPEPVTFKESQEEGQSNKDARDRYRELVQLDDLSSIDDSEKFSEFLKDISSILSSTPSRFIEGFKESEPPEDRDQRVGDIQAIIDALGSQFEGVEGDLANLDQSGLLLDIARSNRVILQSMTSLLQINTELLSAQFDTLESVEPYRQITVSGVNIIENENETVPVVPESEDIDIPSRTLFIKASTNNKGEITIGDDEVEPQNGWILRAGEYIVIDDDLSAEVMYMAGNREGDAVELLGVR